jgi:hypothetical protein
MTAAALKRKGISVDLDVHAALASRKARKEQSLATAGTAREVTYSEILRDLLPELNRK